MEDNLPTQSDEQKIGKEAERVYIMYEPEAWLSVAADGDVDYGIDYIVQNTIEGGKVSHTFYLQIKGTKSPRYISNGGKLSQKFDTKNINYYRLQQTPIMVVVVDIKNCEGDRTKAKAYFRWLDDDFFIENRQKCLDQSTITVHLETSNLLTQDVSVSDYLQRKGREFLAFRELKETVRDQNLDNVKVLEAFNDGLRENPNLISVVEQLGKTDYPWLSDDKTSFSEQLRQSFKLIRQNRLSEASKDLDKIELQLASLTDHERAELYSQRSSILFRNDQIEKGIDCSKVASEQGSLRRYRIGYYETLFLDRAIGTDDVLKEVLGDLDLSLPEECLVAVKCLAMLGRHSEAVDIVEALESIELITKLHFYTVLDIDKEFDAVRYEVDPTKLETDSERLQYHVLVASKLYHRAIKNVETIGNKAPGYGRDNYDYRILKECYLNLKRAWDVGALLGYPYSLEVIFRESVHVYSIYESTEELISNMNRLQDGRTPIKELTECLAVLNSNLGRNQETISLVEQLGDSLTADLASILVYSYYRLGKHRLALELAQKHETLIGQCNDDTKCRTLAIALQCAITMTDASSQKKLIQQIKNVNGGEAVLAIADYFTSAKTKPKDVENFQDELYRKYQILDKPIEIAEQLFNTLDLTTANASIILDLGERILSEYRLDPQGYAFYIDALVQEGQWDRIKQVCDKMLKDFPQSLQWNLVKSAYLEHAGETQQALDVLQELANDNPATIRNISELSFRLGNLDYAERMLLDLLNVTLERDRRLRYLEMLIFIYSSNDDYQDKLESQLMAYGGLVEQNDVTEEGKYLILTLLLSRGATIEEQREFQTRLGKYTNSFPESPILWSMQLPTDASGDQMLKQMNELTGITDERKTRWESNRNRIASGNMLVPFCLLNDILPESSDIFDSWVISKNSPLDRKEFKFNPTATVGSDRIASIVSGQRKVFLDTLSMIILEELGLLEYAIESFGHIYVDRAAYQQIQQAAHPRLGSGSSYVAKAVFETLIKTDVRITVLNSDKDSSFDRLTDHFQNEDFIFICDDSSLAHYLGDCLSQCDVINSINVIRLLADNQVITLNEYYQKVGLYCSFGVSRPSLLRTDIAMLFNIACASTDHDVLSDPNFSNVFDRLFEPGSSDVIRDFRDLCHISSLSFQQEESKPSAADIMIIVDSFALRNSHFQLTDVYASWLILTSLLVEPVFQNEFMEQSLYHKTLWDIYDCTYRTKHGEQASFHAMAKTVMDSIFKMGDNVEETYKRVKSSFLPGTKDYEDFEALYQRMKIAKLNSSENN